MIFKTSNLTKIVPQYTKLCKSIERYNLIQSKSLSFQNQYNSVLQNSTSSIGNYLQSLNGSKASLAGYITYLIKAEASTVALNVVTAVLKTALITGVITGISLLVQQISKWTHAQDELRQKSVELTNIYKEQKSTLDSQIEKYKELNKALNKENISISETRSIKEQLLELQRSLLKSYGNEVSNIDLVNGKYREQLGLLNNLSKEKSVEYVIEHRAAFEDAKKELEKTRTYDIGSITSWTSGYKTDEQQKLIDYVKSYSDLFYVSGNVTPTFAGNAQDAQLVSAYLTVRATAEDADEIMHQFVNDLTAWANENNISEDLIKSLTLDISVYAGKTMTDELKECREIYDEFIKAEVISNDTLRPLYQQSIQAVEDYNNALSSGEGVAEAKANLDSVQQAVRDASGELECSQEVFDNMYDCINKNAEAAYNLEQSFATDKNVQQYAEQLRGLSDFDLMAINFDNDNTEKGEEAFKGLMHVLELTDEQAQVLIDKLVELGYVQGDLQNTELSIADVFSLSDVQNNATALSELNDELSELQSAYNTCLAAKEEFDEQGYLSVDTLQKVLALGGEYLQYLFDEEGNVRLDAEAFQELALAKIDVMEANALSTLEENIRQITDEASATDYLAQKNHELAASYKDAAIGALTEMAALKGFEDSAAMQQAYESYMAQYNQITNLFANARAGVSQTYSGKSKSSSNSSSKKAETDWKSMLDNETTLLEKQLECALITFQEYVEKRRKIIEEYYRNGKISAKDYYDALEKMYDYQKGIYDKVLSAITKRFDREIDLIQDSIDAIEKQNEALEKQKDEYDTILSVVDSVYEKEIENIRSQQDAIQDTIDALQEENDERKFALQLEQAKWELYRAQTQRTKKVFNGTEFIYDTDQDAIRDAQENLADLTLEQTVDGLEKERRPHFENIVHATDIFRLHTPYFRKS